MSAIPFQNIPENIRVPLFYAEVDNSQANTGQQNQRSLLIGQMTKSGIAAPGVPLLSQGPTDAIVQGGPGSQLAGMTAAYRASDPFGEVWYLPLEDDAAAVAASSTLTITGAPTATGTISLYIAGILVTTVVTTADTPTTIAAALVTAIGLANPAVPVEAAAAAGVVTFTALNAGLAGNDINVQLNYRGASAGEVTPPGLTVTITPMTGGATNPTLTSALDALGDMPFDFIICAYTDAASLDALKLFLNDQSGRWSWETQVYGHVFASKAGTVATLTTFGNTRNNQHESVLGFNGSPTPPWVWAADYGGAAAVALRADPGRPLQTLVLHTALPPPLSSRFLLTERNTLLWDGISTFSVAQDGTVALENIITTYQMNQWGQPDDSYLEVETMFLLMFVLRSFASMVTSKYGRMKLADDGTRFAPGAAIVTPSIIGADLIAQYQTLEWEGYVQDSATFAQVLVVQRNANNPNRIDVLWPGTLINQLRIFALLAQFRL